MNTNPGGCDESRRLYIMDRMAMAFQPEAALRQPAFRVSDSLYLPYNTFKLHIHIPK